jgi:hypothetical protein
MKFSSRTRVLPCLLAAGLVVATAVIAVSAAESSAQTFSGQYDWTSGGSEELNVEFIPLGDDRWKVRFRFRFDGSFNTWDGTAEGSLEDGSQLTGTTSWRGRDWNFDAAIEEGVMQGTHAEIRGTKRRETGTFEIRRR